MSDVAPILPSVPASIHASGEGYQRLLPTVNISMHEGVNLSAGLYLPVTEPSI